MVEALLGFVFGVLIWFFLRHGVGGFYTIGPSERAVLTTFGRATRVGEQTTLHDPVSATLRPDERERYSYPQVRVIAPGFYWKLPWQKVHRVSVATGTISIAYDPEQPEANHGGQILEAVTKDQLNIGLNGQLRYAISERNLYAYLFGVKQPVAHVMGYFISILRGRIASFAAPPAPVEEGAPLADVVQTISINDLRKHLRNLNESMNQECASAAARYGISLDAALITGIDSPHEVESALAAINTAYNQVSSEISLAQAAADQKIVMSRRAVEIETLNAQAEVEPLLTLASQLTELASTGATALRAYVRNARLGLLRKTKQLVLSREIGGGHVTFLISVLVTTLLSFALVPMALVVGSLFGLYVVVEERRAVVFELFGQVRAVIDEPGLHCPLIAVGPLAVLVPFFGKKHVVDQRLDQTYLRSQGVNSEEGAPMGIGVWAEMFVVDPVAYLYKNADPRGSLTANVSNATVRCLSNMKLERMLEERHEMSRVVREEVSAQSQQWGYQVGSVYIRKVHFRDVGMIRQIEQKVVNRLRQVTAAIQQDGANRVNIIRSAADREAAIELAKAAAMRPRIVGAAIAQIAQRQDVCDALFDVLEIQQLNLAEGLTVQVIPKDGPLLAELAAATRLGRG